MIFYKITIAKEESKLWKFFSLLYSDKEHKVASLLSKPYSITRIARDNSLKLRRKSYLWMSFYLSAKIGKAVLIVFYYSINTMICHVGESVRTKVLKIKM